MLEKYVLDGKAFQKQVNSYFEFQRPYKYHQQRGQERTIAVETFHRR